MTKKKQLGFYVLTIGLMINLVIGYSLYSESKRAEPDDQVESVRVFVDAVRLLRKNYVDEDKVTYRKMVYAAMRGMVKELDKHSRFHTPEENQSVKEDSDGQFAGIGVTMQMKDDKLVVEKIIPKGPASKTDLRKGDIITAVNGETLVGQDIDFARGLIKGDKGSELLLTIYRESVEAELQIPVIRDLVVIPSVTRVRVLDGGIGYIHIEQFTRTTDSDFELALRNLQKEEVRGLVIDLRGNPGGVLDTAVKMCSFFLTEGDLVLYTQGRDDAHKQVYNAVGGSKFMDQPLIILIDEGSASASEILAACMQDYGKAIIIGEKSYGKGSVQTIADLRDGSAMRFTIAKYFTKSGRTIHNVGIKPDIEVKVTKAERQATHRVLANLFPDEVELTEHDEKDIQLKTAIQVMNDVFQKYSPNKNLGEFFKENKTVYDEKFGIHSVAPTSNTQGTNK
jgi:carboxyl-terminal processing protease